MPGSGGQAESASPVAIRIGSVPKPLRWKNYAGSGGISFPPLPGAKEAGLTGRASWSTPLSSSAFLSPFTNKRTDEYGGSVSNRTRLMRETIGEIKTELGADWPVWVRIHACEGLEPGLSLEEGQEAAKILAGAGADAIHVSAYTLPINKKITGLVIIRVGAIPVKDTPPGPFLGYAAAIKKAVNVPVIAVGKLDDPSLASSAIADGKCDMTALARQLICDPYWSTKVESGRAGEIVRCTYCNSCHTAQQKGEDIRCAQNLNPFGEPVYKRLRRGSRRG